MNKPGIIVILGPTASGKSDMAVELARRLNGEIISADSRQVYKNLDIGTGKITKKEMRGVRHHLLDVCPPSKRFTASDFKKLSEKAISEMISKNKLPIICGGTGFYIDALLGEKQIPEVPPDPKLRKELENKSAGELFEMLKKLDPERAVAIDRYNPRRLVRAIEIAEALGKVPPLRQCPEGQTRDESGIMNYESCKIGIKIPDEELKKRINKRIDKWFRQGLLKECKVLHDKGLSWKRMAEIGLEYKIVSLFLQNKISKQDMIDKMQTETWGYAKRQMTWFKKTKGAVWLPPEIGLIEKETSKFLKR